MKVLEVGELAIPDIKLVRFARFRDDRGYFTEVFNAHDFRHHPDLPFLRDFEILQGNESHSRAGVIRGLHFQWNPSMGKLVRTVSGRMIDLVLDIRKGSPDFGKVIACDMGSGPQADGDQWIWVPPGFAHGNCFTEPTTIEYFCTGKYNPDCEAGISPLDAGLDWSRCDPKLKAVFDGVISHGAVISEKDRGGSSLGAWAKDPRSENFIYGESG